MIELGIKNFQIHKDNKFIFEPGLTLILGQGMSGKTAIFRALETLINNPSSNDEDIHHDAKKMEISLSIPELSKTYTYMKQNNEAEYIINGKNFSKLNRANLGKLDSSFPFTFDEQDNILNVQGEWSFMFPFDRKETGMFQIFEDIFAIFDSNTVIKEFNSQAVSLKKEATSANGELHTNQFKKGKIYSLLSTKYNQQRLIDLNSQLTELNTIKVLPVLNMFPLKEINLLKNMELLNFHPKKLTYSSFEIQEFNFKENQILIELKNIKVLPSIPVFNIQEISFSIQDLKEMEELKLIGNSLKNIKNEIVNLEVQLKAKEKEYSEIEKIICPTCKQEIRS